MPGEDGLWFSEDPITYPGLDFVSLFWYGCVCFRVFLCVLHSSGSLTRDDMVCRLEVAALCPPKRGTRRPQPRMGLSLVRRLAREQRKTSE